MPAKRRRTSKKIPKSTRRLDAFRRGVASFARDLGQALKRRPARPRRGRKPAGKARRNPWVRCQGCYRWVPQVCGYCQRGRIGVTEKHDQPCCPGDCPRCHRCLHQCPGICSAGQHCKDQCPGHDGEED